MSRLNDIRERIPDSTKQRVDEDAKLIDETIAAFKGRLKQKVNEADCYVIDGVETFTKDEVLKLIDETE